MSKRTGYTTYTSTTISLVAAAALSLIGCSTPIKGDASIFSGDKSRTLEVRAKAGGEGLGAFVRERLTTPDYADQSRISHFSLADITYTNDNFAALVGTRSTAKFDVDSIGDEASTGHIDPRAGGIYATKAGDWRFFVNPTVFASFYPRESSNPQFEINTTVGYAPKLTQDVSLDLEAENVLWMNQDRFKQATQRLRGGVSYKGFRAGVGTDMVETDAQAKPAFNTGLYGGVKF